MLNAIFAILPYIFLHAMIDKQCTIIMQPAAEHCKLINDRLFTAIIVDLLVILSRPQKVLGFSVIVFQGDIHCAFYWRFWNIHSKYSWLMMSLSTSWHICHIQSLKDNQSISITVKKGIGQSTCTLYWRPCFTYWVTVPFWSYNSCQIWRCHVHLHCHVSKS